MRRPVEAELTDGRLGALLEPWSGFDRPVYALVPHRALMPAKTWRLLDFSRSCLG